MDDIAIKAKKINSFHQAKICQTHSKCRD